tara:strand:- start:5813 stop:6229 length:417 start_codon:yes stop_codon:yes gene_type:complete
MAEYENNKFPHLGKRKFDKFLKEFERVVGFPVTYSNVNEGDTALYVFSEYEYQDDSFGEDIGNIIDGELSDIFGFSYDPDSTLGRKYPTFKSYSFERRGGVWLAFGDNCYGPEYSRVNVSWDEKLGGDLVERVLADRG